MKRSQHPSVVTVGKVTYHGSEAVITGWALGLCATGCDCHRNPTTGNLEIREQNKPPLLGLVSHRPCTCCTPWTAAELFLVIEDLADAAALLHQHHDHPLPG